MESRGKRTSRRRQTNREDRHQTDGPLSPREALRFKGYWLLAQLAYDLEWRGIPCSVRLPGKREELPVLNFPGGVTGVVTVGVRKESNGWLYTWKDRSVWANAAASDLILSAVS